MTVTKVTVRLGSGNKTTWLNSRRQDITNDACCIHYDTSVYLQIQVKTVQHLLLVLHLAGTLAACVKVMCLFDPYINPNQHPA